MDYNTFLWANYPFRESEAKFVSAEQQAPRSINEAYQQLIAGAKDKGRGQFRDDPFPSFFDNLGSAVRSHIEQASSINTAGEVLIPPLYASTVSGFIEPRVVLDLDQKLTSAQQAIVLFCAIYAEVSYLPMGQMNLSQTKYAAAIHAELASYLSWKALAHSREKADIDIGKAVSNFEETAQKLTNELQQTISFGNDHIIETQKAEIALQAAIKETLHSARTDADSLKSEIEKSRDDISALSNTAAELVTATSTADQNVKSFAKAVREELQIDSTKRLWKNRAWWSTISFSASAILIVVAIAAPILAAYFSTDWIVAWLRHVGEAASAGLPESATNAQLATATISRLVIITIPIALYFWAVKLLVRFNNRSLMLMDDARQRETMMDVYFHLIEKNGATPEERALVLNALFRPAPGQGVDNIEPPNFVDLLSKGTSKPG